MSAEKAVLQAIREDIDALPEPRREAIEEMARHFRLELSAGGTVARVALALVGAELAVEYSGDPVPT